MKYQVGDKVKVVMIVDSTNSIDGIEPDYLINKTGTITISISSLSKIITISATGAISVN